MAFDYTVRSGQKRLRCGYTTGTCAALAAAGSARLLLTGERAELLELMTPKGLPVEVEPEYIRLTSERTAECAVRKDAGDDPDVTDGILVVVTAEKTTGGEIVIDGGVGVGRVTKPGLDQPVGAAAINRVPRQMIRDAAAAVCREAGYGGGLRIVVSLPEGKSLASRTFNPQLGIEGGLSILGTSGVVEPMSEQALIDTIEVSLCQARAESARVILTPGNYGQDFLLAQGAGAAGIPVVKYSNYAGDALDIAAGLRFREALLVGHIGKLVKLAGGIMNTHSRTADCRTELICAHAAVCGAPADVCRSIMDCATTDACIDALDRAGLRGPVLESLLAAIQVHLDRRAGPELKTGAVLFSNQYGLLGMTDAARELLDAWKDRK